MADTNSIVVPIKVDAGKAQIDLQKFEGTLKTFSANYSAMADKIQSQNRSFLGSFTQLATNISFVGVAFQTVKGVVDSVAGSYMAFTDGLSKMSQRTGIAAEKLGALKFAAEQSGANFETLTMGLKKFQENMANNKNTLGVDVSGGTEEALMQFADKIKNMSSVTQQTKAATEAFGRAGFKLLPLLQEGREGISKLTDEAKRLGLTLDETAIQEGVKLTDATNRMKQSFAGVSNQIVANVAPTLTSFFDTLAKGAASITTLVGKVPVFVSTLGKLTVGFMAFAGVAKTIPLIFSSIAAHPVIAVLAGLAVAVAAIDQAMSPIPAKFDAITHSAQTQREELDGVIAADKDAMARLKELQSLSNAGALNNEEMSEAGTLIGELASRYGDLGISVDSVTGKIKGVEQANKRMYQDMVAQRRKALEAERAELERNINSLKTQKTNIENQSTFAYGYNEWISGKNKEDRESFDRQIEAVQRQLADVNSNLESVDSSVQSIDSTTKNGKSPGQIKREIEAQKLLAEENQKTANFGKSARELELEEIAAETKRYDDAYRTKMGFESDAKLVGLDDKMFRAYYEKYKNNPELRAQLKSKGGFETGFSREIYDRMAFLERQQERIKQVNQKYDDLDAEEAQKKKDKEAAEKKRREELMANGVDTRDKDVIDAQKAVDALQDAWDAKTMGTGDKKDKRTVTQIQKELQAAQLELDKAVATATGKGRIEARQEWKNQLAEYNKMKAEGASNADLEKQWAVVEAAEKKYNDQNNQYQSAVGSVRAAQEERANNEISQAKQTIQTATSQGTFNAWEVGSIGNNTARQQLDTMKKMLDELVKIGKNTEEGAVTA